MSRRSTGVLIAATLSLLVTACGEPPAVEISARLRIASALSERIDSLDFYVLGPKMSNDIYISINVLCGRDDARVAPDDPKMDILGYQNVPLDLSVSSITLDEIPAGTQRFIYVGALDADDALIGEGCKGPETIEPEMTTSVTVTVYEYIP